MMTSGRMFLLLVSLVATAVADDSDTPAQEQATFDETPQTGLEAEPAGDAAAAAEAAQQPGTQAEYAPYDDQPDVEPDAQPEAAADAQPDQNAEQEAEADVASGPNDYEAELALGGDSSDFRALASSKATATLKITDAFGFETSLRETDGSLGYTCTPRPDADGGTFAVVVGTDVGGNNWNPLGDTVKIDAEMETEVERNVLINQETKQINLGEEIDCRKENGDRWDVVAKGLAAEYTWRLCTTKEALTNCAEDIESKFVCAVVAEGETKCKPEYSQNQATKSCNSDDADSLSITSGYSVIKNQDDGKLKLTDQTYCESLLLGEAGNVVQTVMKRDAKADDVIPLPTIVGPNVPTDSTYGFFVHDAAQPITFKLPEQPPDLTDLKITIKNKAKEQQKVTFNEITEENGQFTVQLQESFTNALQLLRMEIQLNDNYMIQDLLVIGGIQQLRSQEKPLTPTIEYGEGEIRESVTCTVDETAHQSYPAVDGFSVKLCLQKEGAETEGDDSSGDKCTNETAVTQPGQPGDQFTCTVTVTFTVVSAQVLQTQVQQKLSPLFTFEEATTPAPEPEPEPTEAAPTDGPNSDDEVVTTATTPGPSTTKESGVEAVHAFSALALLAAWAVVMA